MNWDGKITADTPTGRLKQLTTSWRLWLGATVLLASFLVAVETAGYDQTAWGWFVGVTGAMIAESITSGMT